MKAWGVWVWLIGECQEKGGWAAYEQGLVPYVFYHHGPALVVADKMAGSHIAMVCEFAEDGTPIFVGDEEAT